MFVKVTGTCACTSQEQKRAWPILGSVRGEHDAKKSCLGGSKVKATQTEDAEWEVGQGR